MVKISSDLLSKIYGGIGSGGGGGSPGLPDRTAVYIPPVPKSKCG